MHASDVFGVKSEFIIASTARLVIIANPLLSPLKYTLLDLPLIAQRVVYRPGFQGGRHMHIFRFYANADKRIWSYEGFIGYLQIAVLCS